MVVLREDVTNITLHYILHVVTIIVKVFAATIRILRS
jgi:hypothetical protein